jgi:hypothetical protein
MMLKPILEPPSSKTPRRIMKKVILMMTVESQSRPPSTSFLTKTDSDLVDSVPNSNIDENGLRVVTAAETTADVDELEASGEGAGELEEGRGKRRKVKNRRYDIHQFYQHWDEDDSDTEQ